MSDWYNYGLCCLAKQDGVMIELNDVYFLFVASRGARDVFQYYIKSRVRTA